MTNAKDEFLEVSCLGEIVTLGVMRLQNGAWQITISGWGQTSTAEAAFGAVCRHQDTRISFPSVQAAKKAVEEGLGAQGVRERGPWKKIMKNRSDSIVRVQCCDCKKKVDRWKAEAHQAKTPTGIGFYCNGGKCSPRELQKTLF